MMGTELWSPLLCRLLSPPLDISVSRAQCRDPNDTPSLGVPSQPHPCADNSPNPKASQASASTSNRHLRPKLSSWLPAPSPTFLHPSRARPRTMQPPLIYCPLSLTSNPSANSMATLPNGQRNLTPSHLQGHHLLQAPLPPAQATAPASELVSHSTLTPPPLQATE